jgi:hypothetical protein
MQSGRSVIKPGWTDILVSAMCREIACFSYPYVSLKASSPALKLI